MEDHDQQAGKLDRYLLENLARIARLLGQLPVPVNLPNMLATNITGLSMIESVHASITMAEEQLDDTTADSCRSAFLLWIAAFETVALFRSHPIARNFDVANLLCEHTEAALIVAAYRLNALPQ